MITAIDLTGTKNDIEAILVLARQHSEVEEISEPMNLDASRALNVGLPEISAALTFVTVLFKTSKALLEFLKALREELKTRGGAVAVAESAGGKPLGRLEGQTTDETLNKLLPPSSVIA
jgi:hypothetical protein